MQKQNLEHIINIGSYTKRAITHVTRNALQYSMVPILLLAGNPNGKVKECHKTESPTKPYVQNTVSVSAIVNDKAHPKHHSGGDIIPPFNYWTKGEKGGWEGPFRYEGRNWPGKKDIWKNGCIIPPEPTATYTQQPIPTFTPFYTDTPVFTDTPIPTDTPVATDTPVFTDTPLPPGFTPTVTFTDTATVPPVYTQTSTPVWPTGTVEAPPSKGAGYHGNDNILSNPLFYAGLLTLGFLPVALYQANKQRKAKIQIK